MDFAIPAKHRVKMNESEKIDKNYLDLARELKKPWNIKMTVVLIADSTLRMVLKG